MAREAQHSCSVGFGGSMRCGRCGLCADADALAAALRSAASEGRDGLPPGRSGRRAVHRTSGSVKVVLPSDEGAEPAIVAVLGRGRVLRRAGAARRRAALGPTIADRADRDARPPSRRVPRLIDDQPELRRALLASLAVEIRRLTGHVEDLHFLDLPGRPRRHSADRRLSGATACRRRRRHDPDRVAVHPVGAGRA